MSPEKRRRVSEDNAAPSIVPSSGYTGDGSGRASTQEEPQQPLAVVVVEPQLDEVAELVLVWLQKETDYDVVEALKELDRLLVADDDDKIQTSALGVGAPAILVLKMHQWRGHEEVQAWCCSCLSGMAYENQSIAFSIVRLGGVEAIVTAMKAFPKSYDVQMNACHALCNIFYIPWTPVKIVLRRFVEEMDGLKLIGNTMKTFKVHADVQTVACDLLENIADQKEFHPELSKCGVAAVATALEIHSEEKEVKRAATGFMKKLFAHNG